MKTTTLAEVCHWLVASCEGDNSPDMWDNFLRSCLRLCSVPLAASQIGPEPGPGSPFELRLAYLGFHLVQLGQITLGTALLDEAILLNPGHGIPFTLRGLALLTPFARPPVEASNSHAGISPITMNQLGCLGRFGNQLLQYMYLRVLCQKCQCAHQTGAWVGSLVFGLDDPLITDALPPLVVDDGPPSRILSASDPQMVQGHDLQGYCLVSTRWYQPYRHFLQELLQVIEPWRTPLQAQREYLTQRGRDLIVIHLRRGDFGEGPFWVAPASWYEKWLCSHWEEWDRPVLYVATDGEEPFPELRYFEPHYPWDLPPPPPGAEFLRDHWLMQQVDHLAISNSSYSFTAAMLNRGYSSTVRPDPLQQALVHFDPWDAEPVLAYPSSRVPPH